MGNDLSGIKESIALIDKRLDIIDGRLSEIFQVIRQFFESVDMSDTYDASADPVYYNAILDAIRGRFEK